MGCDYITNDNIVKIEIVDHETGRVIDVIEIEVRRDQAIDVNVYGVKER